MCENTQTTGVPAEVARYHLFDFLMTQEHNDTGGVAKKWSDALFSLSVDEAKCASRGWQLQVAVSGHVPVNSENRNRGKMQRNEGSGSKTSILVSRCVNIFHRE